MTPNVGRWDRLLRVVAGAGFLVAAVLGGTDVADALGLVGVALMVTGLAGRCLVYQVLGLSTRDDGPRSEQLHASH
jgi:hypothetical protein